MAIGITGITRVIITICEHVVTEESLPCGSKRIRIDESADAGIVISALEVVEPGISGGAVAVVLDF